MGKTKPYKQDFLNYGFTVTDEGNPQCVLCYRVLSNSSMKPNKLVRHLKTEHNLDVGDKNSEYFQRKLRELEAQKDPFKKLSQTEKGKLRASYLVSARIAKEKKPFNIGESLILPAAVDMCREVIGEDSVRKIKEVPLSATTVRRRIQDMSEDIEDQLISKMKSCRFSIQLDESTDITNKALLLVFVKFHGDEKFFEDILFCGELEERTTGEDVFQLIDAYMDRHGIQRINCVGVCTDGAAAMTGKNSGAVKRILEKAPDAKWIHCFLHRENLAAKKMSQPLSEVMSQVVKIINFIKSSALNSRLFEKLCERMESDHLQLLYFSEVRWLSRGKALNRLVELREEVEEFLREKNSPLAEHLQDESFVSVLAYMADIFDKLNVLNSSMQGKNSSVFQTCDKIEGFKLKIELWENAIDQGNFEMFPTLSELLIALECEAPVCIIKEHLQKLSEQLKSYFEVDLRERNEWIRNPFIVEHNDPTNLNIEQMASLMDLKCDGSLKITFREHTLSEFWLAVKREYPELTDKAVAFLLPFCTTWMCESGFSVVVATKTKARNRLSTENLESILRVALSPLQPRIDNIIREKQAHPSH